MLPLRYDLPERDNTTFTLSKINPERAAAWAEIKTHNFTIKSLTTLFLPLTLLRQPEQSQITTIGKHGKGTSWTELYLGGRDSNLLFYPLTRLSARPDVNMTHLILAADDRVAVRADFG